MEPDELRDALLPWYGRHARDLPWRRPGTDAWGVLVCEFMAQQTPVARVAPVWTQWLDRWPKPSLLAGASTAEVLTAWANLGYPRRALRLHECARVISTEHRDVVPTDYASLRALPGVGDYTAAAVLAFGHARRAVVLDTNIRRVLARAGDGTQWPSASIRVTERETMNALLPDGTLVVDGDAHPASRAAAQLSASLMELGACVCASVPQCDRCPLIDMCAWRAAGYPTSASPRRPQPFHGTDRQMRGRIMRLLRESWPHAVPQARIHELGDDADQVARALEGLIADGLVHKQRGGKVSLPTS